MLFLFAERTRCQARNTGLCESTFSKPRAIPKLSSLSSTHLLSVGSRGKSIGVWFAIVILDTVQFFINYILLNAIVFFDKNDFQP